MHDVAPAAGWRQESLFKSVAYAFSLAANIAPKRWNSHRFTHRRVALLASVSLHITLVLAVLMEAGSNLNGQPEGKTGRSQAPASAVTAKIYQMSPDRKTAAVLVLMPVSKSALERTQLPDPIRLTIRKDAIKKADATPKKPAAEKSPDDDEKSPTRSQDLLDILKERTQPATASLGRPDGHATLTEQIARCLPPEARQTRSSATLLVSLDQYGNLVQAPKLEPNLASISQEKNEMAEIIIQATIILG
jgi:hypothetical protein